MDGSQFDRLLQDGDSLPLGDLDHSRAGHAGAHQRQRDNVVIWLEALRMALGAIGAHDCGSALTWSASSRRGGSSSTVMTGKSVIADQMEPSLSSGLGNAFQAQK